MGEREPRQLPARVRVVDGSVFVRRLGDGIALAHHPQVKIERVEPQISVHSEVESMPRKLGPLIRQLRISRRIGLRRLAHLVGISPGDLSNIEVGRRPPALWHLVTIARVLEVQIVISPAAPARVTRPEGSSSRP